MRKKTAKHRIPAKRKKNYFPVTGIAVLVIAGVVALSFLLGSGRRSPVKETSSDGISDTTSLAAGPIFAADSQSESAASSGRSSTGISNSSNVSKSSGNSSQSLSAAASSEVQESSPADNSYFDDAAFVGDSRTQGLILYTSLTKPANLAYKGLSVDTVYTAAVIPSGDKMITVMDALTQNHYAKIYIMLGINEIGWPNPDHFITKMGEIVDQIKADDPGSVIYLQPIIPVTASKMASDPVFDNHKIASVNGELSNLATEKGVYFVNVCEALQDANGNLPEDAASDGVHLKKAYCQMWLDYLKAHTAP